jgi:ADP-ribose pyrophosphatase YjhB (NUDIX family)
MLDYVKFKYCPYCGEQCLQPNDAKSFLCSSCGFVYYHGSSAVVAAIIEYEDKIILSHRANESQKNIFALPGGFVDYDENLEDAIIREIREELNLVIMDPIYVCSQGERYISKNVVYFCTIAFFKTRINNIDDIIAQDDIDEFLFIRPNEIDYSKLAFDTDKFAIDKYLRSFSSERQ